MHSVFIGMIVDELRELLNPSWGAEKWILEGWNKINKEEKELIKARMHELFKDGLPFEVKQDKLLYTYTFSLLAQLEVLAIQIPLKFEDKMSTPQFKQQMRVQLLDEIFHGMVFIKIAYMLSAPYATPPAYNENIEALCDYIRNEECPKVALMMLNLVAEGWIEEVFQSLDEQKVAPKVFTTILADEHRHVLEADLYREIGIPEKAILQKKLGELEESLLTNIMSQPKYLLGLSKLLGQPATHKLIQSLQDKHTQQLKKINMIPTEQWRLIMEISRNFIAKTTRYDEHSAETEMSPTRKIFMTQWNKSGDPNMVGQFNLDVSSLDFFEKKYPPETVTTLLMQVVSEVITEEGSLRCYLSHKKMYQSEDAYVSIVVKLPGCGGHIGNIVFRNCHQITALELSSKIRRALKMMVYCYQKREQMEKKHPHLKQSFDALLYDYAHDTYPYPIPGHSFVSVSGIGFSGYSQAVSPLRRQETVKVTLLAIERKPVWNPVSKTFEPKDMLPISVSADHRIIDGNMPIPKMFDKSFQAVFQRMLEGAIQPIKSDNWVPNMFFGKLIDKLLETNMVLGYQTLAALQTMWPDFMKIEDIFSAAMTKNVVMKKLETLRG